MSYGEQLSISVNAVNQSTDTTGTQCAQPTSPWQPLRATFSIGLGGEIVAKPEIDAPIISAIRAGTRIEGPFYEHPALNDWLLIGEFPDAVFTLRKNLELSK